MSLQGNLRDFSVSEILQLLSTQKKTGSLELQWGTEKAVVYLQEGTIVSAREPGKAADDALLLFLRKVHRLSDEQVQGVLAILRESRRDLEDVLLKGRYMDGTELGRLLERHILDAVMGLLRWENGSYRFDPNRRWPGPVVTRLSVESALIEASRRVDEHRRFMATFKDPFQVLGIRDLPDPDKELYDEERELFAIVDSQRTVEQILEAAPLTEYEAYEALDRMLQHNWIEVVGRRDPGVKAAPRAAAAPTPARARLPWLREVVFAAGVLACFAALTLGSRTLAGLARPAPAGDVMLQTRLDQVEYALRLHHRERGVYPANLRRLVDEEWLAGQALELPGYRLRYRAARGGASYTLDLVEEP